MEMYRVEIPVLKAWNRVFELLAALDENPYNRFGFQDAVLNLYPGKSPKSVFRGMAVPTLRRLGLMVGYGDVIRISANGALINAASQMSPSEGLRTLRAILLEMDLEIGMLVYIDTMQMIHDKDLIEEWIPVIKISDSRIAESQDSQTKGARERLQDWLRFLIFAQLLISTGDSIRIDGENLSQAKDDIEAREGGKRELFNHFFFSDYRMLVVEQRGIRTVEIESLRRKLAMSVYRQIGVLITEMQFDWLLAQLPMTSEEYTITFGRSMGADEKLFSYKGKFYQTLSIRSDD